MGNLRRKPDPARERVEEAVSQHIEEWAAASGLTCTDKFKEDVTEALHAFMRAHIATPGRWRWSTVRKAFFDVADDYAAISKLLRHWESGRDLPPLHLDPRFKDLPPLWPEPPMLRAVLAPFGNGAKFSKLAKAARHYAALCVPDEGSRPRSIAFDTLCVGLLDGLERATKRKAALTRHWGGKWGGDYFRLVEAVWPVACEVAEAVANLPVRSSPPTSEALGQRLKRLLKRLGRDL